MTRGGGTYDRTVRFLAGVYLVIGVVILVLTLVRGGGPASLGVVLGILFIALGAGRILLQRKIGRDR